MAIKSISEVRGRWKNDLVTEKKRYAAAAQRKAQRAAHAGWRGDEPLKAVPKDAVLKREMKAGYQSYGHEATKPRSHEATAKYLVPY